MFYLIKKELNAFLNSLTGEDVCLYTYVDDNVVDGFEYTYAVTAYDMGVSGASEVIGSDGSLSTTYIANPDEWANPKGYQSIETSRGTTVYDPNFVVIVPGYKSSTSPTEESLKEITVVPNPYVAASNFNETAYLRSNFSANASSNSLQK